MPKTYQVNGAVRFSNRMAVAMIRLGIVPKNLHVLTVRGRQSGALYSNPVSLVFANKKRYLVSPYGIVSWVKNARAAGEVTLTRGSKQETLKIREAPPAEAAPVLKLYFTNQPITRPYFSVTMDSPVEAFEAEVAQHPVFELITP